MTLRSSSQQSKDGRRRQAATTAALCYIYTGIRGDQEIFKWTRGATELSSCFKFSEDENDAKKYVVARVQVKVQKKF